MHYQVPQFIDVEDKIVGPLTLRQFFYLAGAFLISFFAFFRLVFFVWFIFTLFEGSIALILAFFKYNGRPFSLFLRSVFRYLWRPQKYVWQKENQQISSPQKRGGLEFLNFLMNTSRSPLQGERSFTIPFLHLLQKNKERYEVFRKSTGERDVARRVDYR